MFEHFGLVHNNAIRCAAVGPSPRCTTFATSTPLVITSLRINSPKSSRAVRIGTGPTPTISHVPRSHHGPTPRTGHAPTSETPASAHLLIVSSAGSRSESMTSASNTYAARDSRRPSAHAVLNSSSTNGSNAFSIRDTRSPIPRATKFRPPSGSVKNRAHRSAWIRRWVASKSGSAAAFVRNHSARNSPTFVDCALRTNRNSAAGSTAAAPAIASVPSDLAG